MEQQLKKSADHAAKGGILDEALLAKIVSVRNRGPSLNKDVVYHHNLAEWQLRCAKKAALEGNRHRMKFFLEGAKDSTAKVGSSYYDSYFDGLRASIFKSRVEDIANILDGGSDGDDSGGGGTNIRSNRRRG